MHFSPPFRTFMSERADMRSSVHIPMVYEDVQPAQQPWEYHVLTIDSSENALPDVAQLNELGQQGWILAGIVDERVLSRGKHVYYYFMRQKVAA